jgi:hypothetical protein
MLRKFLRHSPDPAEGVPVENPSGPPPPAAKKVLDNPGAKETDAAEIVALRSKLEKTAADKKKVETRAAELEDENRRLKAVPNPPPAPEKKRFLSGEDLGGFFA